MKVGINGFGRIGRAIYRINHQRKLFDISRINDINVDPHNIAYQLKYDSTYGRFLGKVEVFGSDIKVDGAVLRVSRQGDIAKADWNGCDAVIDASGVLRNAISARRLNQQGVKWVFVTNAPDPKYVDRYVVIGVNESEVDPQNDHVISTSICDANAFAPVARALDEAYGVAGGFVTTLHPWLGFQNLLDGPSKSFAFPGQIHSHYPLGRASSGSLIPKPTSAVTAAEKVLPHLKGRFLSVSYRVPTAIVGSADITVKLKRPVAVKDVISHFIRLEKKQRFKVFHNNFEPLVSIDFVGSDYSVILDHRWTTMNDDNYLKLMAWYDNEWGYGSRVVDLIGCYRRGLSQRRK